MRAVLDSNVLVSALLSRDGPPAELLRRWLEGEFELVVSAALLRKLERVLGYSKIEARLEAGRGLEFLRLLAEEAVVAADPAEAGPPAAEVPDPNDEYLIRLAVTEAAVIVSGDRHLTLLAPEFPVHTPAKFVALLDSSSARSG